MLDPRQSRAFSFGRIGLGCATFGREIDEVSSCAMMDHALRRGVNLFDTAAAYSLGASERIVGNWLRSRCPARESLSIATKILPPYTPVQIEIAVCESLRRLRVESIDLLFLHKWIEAAASPATLGALDQLLRRGLVRAIGVSNFTAGQLQRVLKIQHANGFTPVRALQNNNNLAISGIDAEIRDVCMQEDITLVSYSPLAAGFLTGKHQNGVQPASRFAIIPGHAEMYFNKVAFRRLARLQFIAKRSNIPDVRLALAWALHQPGVNTVLVGGRKTEHIDEAFEAFAIDDPELLQELTEDIITAKALQCAART